MEHRQLGTEGPDTPVVGLGAFPLGGAMGRLDEQVAIDTVRAAIDSGITLIDTARGYQTSEETIGKALKGGYRDRCFLATNVSGDFSREGIVSSMEDSLRALEIDHVDLPDPPLGPGVSDGRKHGGVGPVAGGGQDPLHRCLQL